MKKKALLSILVISLSTKVFAAGAIFGDWANTLNEEIKSNFFIVAGIVFLVSGLFNLGNFFGETRDYKKGFTNIAVFVAGVMVVMGAFSYITSLSL